MLTLTPSDAAIALAPVIGQMVWQVRRGLSNSLTMEFGNPRLVIREALPPSQIKSEGEIGEPLAKRRVSVYGDWHLWIQHTDGAVVTRGQMRATSESEEEIDRALRHVDGLVLMDIQYRQAEEMIVLMFEGDCEIQMTSFSPSPHGTIFCGIIFAVHGVIDCYSEVRSQPSASV